jgi:hypothetical protein
LSKDVTNSSRIVVETTRTLWQREIESQGVGFNILFDLDARH